MGNTRCQAVALEKVAAGEGGPVRVVFCEPGESTAEANISAGVVEGLTLFIQFVSPKEQKPTNRLARTACSCA